MRGRPTPEGTRKLDDRGYTLVRLSKGHPYANSSGWQYEHRLVIMETLGRRLRRGERVMHSNGDIADNRIENLVHIEDAPPPPHCRSCTCD